jgi:hypothetical protein
LASTSCRKHDISIYISWGPLDGTGVGEVELYAERAGIGAGVAWTFNILFFLSIAIFLEKETAPGAVLFHVALEGLLAGQLVAAQGELRQGSELPQLGRNSA